MRICGKCENFGTFRNSCGKPRLTGLCFRDDFVRRRGRGQPRFFYSLGCSQHRRRR